MRELTVAGLRSLQLLEGFQQAPVGAPVDPFRKVAQGEFPPRQSRFDLPEVIIVLRFIY